MHSIINTAIVGFGLSGRAFHAPFLHVHPGFQLTKVVERHRDESKQLYPEITVVNDFKELLDDKLLDLIVICTPNTLHFPMAKAALLAGKHIVIEKPFTPTSSEALELIGIAKKVNRKVFVYHNRRWDGDFLTIKKILKSEWYEVHFDRFRPELEPGKWRDEAKPGGGILFDLGSHLIDQALTLFGLPDKLNADIQSQCSGSQVDDYFRLELNYPDMKAILTASMKVKEGGPRFIIHGSRGSYVKYGIDPQEEALRNRNIPNSKDWGKENEKGWGYLTMEDEHIEFDGQIETMPGCYQCFYENVYDVLVNQKEMYVLPGEAAEVIRIIELSFESAKHNLEMKVTT